MKRSGGESWIVGDTEPLLAPGVFFCNFFSRLASRYERVEGAGCAFGLSRCYTYFSFLFWLTSLLKSYLYFAGTPR